MQRHWDARLYAVPSNDLAGIGLDLMLASLTSDDECDLAATAPPSVIGGPGSGNRTTGR
jgi:hypothetical protein